MRDTRGFVKINKFYNNFNIINKQMHFIDIKAIEVKSIIENDVSGMTSEEIDEFFTKKLCDRRVILFTKFYNKTVLDKEKFNFGEFKHQWAIQGMKKYIYQYFEDNFE